jgi:hypothetical protein
MSRASGVLLRNGSPTRQAAGTHEIRRHGMDERARRAVG